MLTILDIKCSIEEKGLHRHSAAVNTGQCSIILPNFSMKISKSNELSSLKDIILTPSATTRLDAVSVLYVVQGDSYVMDHTIIISVQQN